MQTTQDQRDYAKGLADQVVNDSVPLSRRLAYGLALDADRLANLEDGIRALADKWENEDVLDSRFAFTPSECAQQARDLLDGE